MTRLSPASKQRHNRPPPAPPRAGRVNPRLTYSHHNTPSAPSPALSRRAPLPLFSVPHTFCPKSARVAMTMTILILQISKVPGSWRIFIKIVTSRLLSEAVQLGCIGEMKTLCLLVTIQPPMIKYSSETMKMAKLGLVNIPSRRISLQSMAICGVRKMIASYLSSPASKS